MEDGGNSSEFAGQAIVCRQNRFVISVNHFLSVSLTSFGLFLLKIDFSKILNDVKFVTLSRPAMTMRLGTVKRSTQFSPSNSPIRS